MPKLGELFGWSGNSFYDAFSSNRNMLSGAVLGASVNPGDPWAGAATGAQRGGIADEAFALQQEAEAKRADQINQTAAYLRQQGAEDLAAAVEGGMMDGSTAFSTWYSAQNQAPGENLMSVGGHLYDKSSGQWISPPSDANGSPRVSLSGQWGLDTATQQPVYLQPSDTGELIPAQVPEGVQLLGPYGTSADRAAGSAFGKGTGSAQFDLPAAALTTQQTLEAINSVRQQSAGMDEQFGNILGVPQQVLPTMPQSERANFQVETNRLINRTFLEAREVLRGGGQITDFESRKAEGAISNLEEAMARGDKALFQKSLDELEQAVSDGYAKLQSQAGSMPGYGGGLRQPAPAVGGGVDDILSGYGL